MIAGAGELVFTGGQTFFELNFFIKEQLPPGGQTSRTKSFSKQVNLLRAWNLSFENNFNANIRVGEHISIFRFLSWPELTKIAFGLQDDILTAAFCPPNYLATASFDGDIILWSLDREKMMRRLKKGSGSLLYAEVSLSLLLSYSFRVDKIIFANFLILMLALLTIYF